MAFTPAIATPNIFAIITAVSIADLVNKVVAIFVAAGWTIQSTITGGYQLLGTSPQGYLVYADIFKFTDGNFYLVLKSAVGSGAVGAAYALPFDPSGGYLYQVIAYPCGFSICEPNKDAFPGGSAIIGGIPFVGSNCGVSGSTITEIWFSFGDYFGSPFFAASNPRLNIDIGPVNRTGNQTGCLNGTMALMTASVTGYDVPEILRISSAAPDAVSNSHPLLYGEQPLLYPPFISWPVGAGSDPITIRGQIYNAAVRSATSPKQLSLSFLGHNWINYTSSYFFGSLWVLKDNGAARTFGNYHY